MAVATIFAFDLALLRRSVETAPCMRWLRDPVVHFLVLGSLIFALYALVAEPTRDGFEEERLRVPDALVLGIARDLEARRGRPPSRAELDEALDRWVTEEVLYREGLSLELDRGDPIVRRRVVQKMRFLLEEMAVTAEPSDDELRRLLEADPARYQLPGTLTLTQVFVRAEREDGEADAHLLLLDLMEGADPATRGDPFPHGRRLGPRSLEDFSALFGPEFARSLATLEPGSWTLLPSSFGWHAVRVEERSDPGPGQLDALRERLSADWKRQHTKAGVEQAIAKLRTKYDAQRAGTEP
jgi:hypothetical protein